MTRALTRPASAAAVVLGASLAVLGATFAFEYLGGLLPCPLCIWQRYAHGATIMAAGLALAVARPGPAVALLGLAAASLLTGAGIAFFHVGVEEGWWQGTASCGGSQAPAASLEELRARLLAQPLVRCDEVAWSLFGVSMAGYNLALSLALALYAGLAAGRAIPSRAGER
ncbi:MAG: disulfide bond formation protein B [Pseudomonadota bacterium]